MARRKKGTEMLAAFWEIKSHSEGIGAGRKPRSAAMLEAFGETKSLAEWVNDPRCVVGQTTLKARLKLNWDPEKALSSAPLHAPVTPTFIEAFGERRRIGAWTRDPRCSVSGSTITERILSGMSPEKAITLGPRRIYHGKIRGQPMQITAFGETKTPVEWAKDPRCSVKAHSVWQRLVRGIDPEHAITLPAKRGFYRFDSEGNLSLISRSITAWGETKSAPEWADDPRCAVSRNTMLIRLRKGMPAEEAISTPNAIAFDPAITAFGETKSGQEWKADPRMKVDSQTFYRRLQKGIDPESAMTARHIKPQTVWLTAWGETKTAAEWSRDPRCRVDGTVLTKRSKVWAGAEHELIITAPPRFMYKFAHGPLLDAFGESKSLAEWLVDPRRQVPIQTVTGRLHHRWGLEDAMTIPINGRKQTGRPGYLHEAFGEHKTLTQWAADPRCKVGRDKLEIRLHSRWELERAITSPYSPLDRRKGWKRKDSRLLRLTVFGETKTTGEWADDPRCSVGAGLLADRIRKGWTHEDAVTLPKLVGSPGHTGVRKSPKSSPIVTAFGETKPLCEWARDPRAQATNDQMNQRLKAGWAPEDAITRPKRHQRTPAKPKRLA